MKRKREKIYGVFRNSAFMIGTAWKKRPSLLWLCMGMVIVTVAFSVTQLFLMPAILNGIENAIPVGRFIAMTVFFGAVLTVLSGVNAYLLSCITMKRIEVRLHIGAMIQNKILTMSYPDLENQDVRKKMDKASMLVNNANEAAEAIWSTFTDLLKNGAEFVICSSLFAGLNPLLMVTVIMTASVSFLDFRIFPCLT